MLTDTKFMKCLKTFCYDKIESLFIHIIMANSTNLYLHLPKNKEEFDKDDKVFQIEFRQERKKIKQSVLIFEKQGNNDSLVNKLLKKWKEILIFIFMFILLITLSMCNKSIENMSEFQ